MMESVFSSSYLENVFLCKIFFSGDFYFFFFFFLVRLILLNDTHFDFSRLKHTTTSRSTLD